MRPFVPPTQGYWLRITAKKKPTDRPEWQCVRAHAPRLRRTSSVCDVSAVARR
jgi:hypothetical protein